MYWKEKVIWKKAKPDKLWNEFSLYIRIRDAIRTTGTIDAFKCISSGKIVPVKGNDAGHYISRSNKMLKYDVRNVHAQSAHDNRFLSGNLLEYRKNMIRLYSEDIVEELENTRAILKYVDVDQETIKWRNRRKKLQKLKFNRGMIEEKMKTFSLEDYLDSL